MSQGFNVGASAVGSNAQPPGSIAGHSGLTSLQHNSSMALASDSHPSPGLGSMGLPASPRSFSSGSLTSLVRHQVGSPHLSRLEQQENQLHQHLQQTSSVTPPSQLLLLQQQQQQQSQSVQQQDQLPQGSQQQVVAQLLGNGSPSVGIGQQGLGVGASAQQVVGLVNTQQQALTRVKLEPQQADQSLQHLQQQLMIPKREMKSEDAVAHQLQRQDLQMQRQQHPHQLHPQQNLLQQQQQRLLQQQQQLLHSRHLQRSPLQLQQHQHELQLQQHVGNLQTAAQPKQPAFEPGVCARRLMEYMCHQRHRPQDNNIMFWRKFVAEYFAPRAKKRWCVSLYGSGGRQPTGVFPQDVWQCEICGSKPGRGFETTVEVLPRLCKIKYDSGITEELLFVDLPNEYCLSSGQLVLEYGKAIQESVFQQLRVVRDGQLRIIFSADLKIMSWEFCARSHEELLPRRLIIPQVTSLAAIAQKYQTSASQSAGGLSLQEMQTNCSLFVTSARQLARNLEVPTVNDLGYTKRYVRCLQISEVVNSMKDLIDFSQENRIGPIDSLHSFPRQSSQAAGGLIGDPAQQQQQQQDQQQEQLELQNLIADTGPNNSLSSLQHQLNTGSGSRGNSLSSPIHDGVSNPLMSFLHRGSLPSLQEPLQSSLQNSHETDFSNSLGGGLHGQQHQLTLPPPQQQQASGVGGSRTGSHQNSPTNSLSSLQNSRASFSVGGLAGSSSNRNLLSSTLQQNTSGAVGVASLLEQQQQTALQSSQGSQHQHHNTQNVAHHVLQEMMMNQEMNRGSSFQQPLGLSDLDGNQGVNGGFSGSMNSFTGAGGGHGTGTANLGVGSNRVISNQLGLNSGNLGGLAGVLSPIGGAGGNTALVSLGNHSLRSLGSGLGSLGGNTGVMNTLNGRLNLAGMGQQQDVQMQDPSHQSHHELGGTGLLGDGLSTPSGFGGIQFNWKTP
ncbi:hypothetical protein CY35_03G082500 [Sphagnum magellanicum]|nr:hypothetical protein CY35_03G082500 [Sphagnum magellanicum]